LGLTAIILENESFFQDTWKYIRQRARGHRIDAPPIFVVGCGHSGTSVLLRLLGAHSKIYGVPYESKVFRYPDLKQRLTVKIWNRNAVAQRKHRWAEKTPIHVQMIDRIFKMYSEAKVLFLIRDGRDVAVSMRKRFGEFETGLARWVDDNRQGLSWSDDSRVMSVRYEDLVKQYDDTMPRICKFIGESFEEGLIDYHEAPAYDLARETKTPGSEWRRDHADYRTWQMNQKLFDGSGKWIKEMTETEKARFKADKGASQLLIDFGYATNSDW
jgi:hypothetical protein